ncbi:MAG: tryptophan synthase subunit alpha [Peptococcaceae bacterium]|nr:tryptophan synthase subunit alpha [Peptococcaceae bacterium]
MIKIAEAFRSENPALRKKAFIAYLMAGDPDPETSADYILTAQEAGADLIEIGIPFSDPIAEGEVIQAASLRALQAGTTLDTVFDMVSSIKDRMHIPMVFMTYLNPVYAYGYDRFFARCADSGVSGIIIPDMPFEEQAEAKGPANKYSIDVITLVAPTSATRTAQIARNAQGFIYLVSSMGVTGMRRELTTDQDRLAHLASIVEDIRKETDTPVAIGFGVSTPEQAGRFAAIADGVIVGSAIVDIIGKCGKEAKPALHDFIAGIKEKVICG